MSEIKVDVKQPSRSQVRNKKPGRRKYNKKRKQGRKQRPRKGAGQKPSIPLARPSLTVGNAIRTTQPKKAGGPVRISGTDVVLPMQATSTFTLTPFYICPTVSSLFPKLSAQANTYQRWRPRYLNFRYMPACPATLQGTVAIAIEPNALETGSPPGTLVSALNKQMSAAASCWTPFFVRYAQKFDTNKWLQTTFDDSEPTSLQNSLAGILYLMTDNGDDESSFLGYFVVDYDIEFDLFKEVSGDTGVWSESDVPDAGIALSAGTPQIVPMGTNKGPKQGVAVDAPQQLVFNDSGSTATYGKDVAEIGVGESVHLGAADFDYNPPPDRKIGPIHPNALAYAKRFTSSWKKVRKIKHGWFGQKVGQQTWTKLPSADEDRKEREQWLIDNPVPNGDFLNFFSQAIDTATGVVTNIATATIALTAAIAGTVAGVAALAVDLGSGAKEIVRGVVNFTSTSDDPGTCVLTGGRYTLSSCSAGSSDSIMILDDSAAIIPTYFGGKMKTINPKHLR